MKYTSDELKTAIETARYIQVRDGKIVSKVLLNELSRRTGKPYDYFNIIEILLQYKLSINRHVRKLPILNDEHKIIILQTAEQIAEKRRSKFVTSDDIKNILYNRKSSKCREIVHSFKKDINKILHESGYITKYNNEIITAIQEPSETNTTREKRKERCKIYYQNNKQKILDQGKEYRKKNRKQYNAEHREEKSAYNKKYYAEHREKNNKVN